jgi:hypothetical protein
MVTSTREAGLNSTLLFQPVKGNLGYPGLNCFSGEMSFSGLFDLVLVTYFVIYA